MKERNRHANTWAPSHTTPFEPLDEALAVPLLHEVAFRSIPRTVMGGPWGPWERCSSAQGLLLAACGARAQRPPRSPPRPPKGQGIPAAFDQDY